MRRRHTPMAIWTLVVVLLAARGSAGPLAPAAAIGTFRLPVDLLIELVAAEPDVVDPVAISFDERGRLYVAEYRDYPNGPAPGQPPLSRVRLLEDADCDGRFERATVFADGLSFAQGVMALDGGILVTAAPQVLFLKDTDGDGRADERKILFEGFAPGNPQLRVAHPRRGIDNWIYLSNGLSGGTVTSGDPSRGMANLQGHDFRFHPQTLAFEPASGFGQFGNTFDDWGHRFFCSNRNPTMTAILPYRALVRNPYLAMPRGYEDVADFGGAAHIYPIAQTQTTAFEHTGTYTAACGVHVHRGTALGPDYSGDIYVCDPTGYLVTRSKLRPKGASFRAERAVPGVDFLASTDTWFRPVSLADGPDGSLYIVDMYRAVIEHPQYMPPGLAETLDLRAGDDRGRIYRIRARGIPPAPYLPSADPNEWLTWLTSPIGWRRDLAQRLLVERANGDVVARLENFLGHEDPRTRLHALGTLEGLKALTTKHVERALADPDPRVVVAALVAAEPLLPDSAELSQAIGRLAPHADPRVRLHAALALGSCAPEIARPALTRLARSDFSDPWISKALLISARDTSGPLLTGLLADAEFRRPTGGSTTERIELVTSLAAMIGARGDAEELARLAKLLDTDPIGLPWWKAAIIAGLGEGLSRHHGSLGLKSLAAFVDHPPGELEGLARSLRDRLGEAGRVASDRDRPTADRVAATELLAYLPPAEVLAATRAVLETRPPLPIQSACVGALSVAEDAAKAELLLEYWTALSPAARSAASDLLLRKPRTTLALLDAMAGGPVRVGDLSFEQRALLLASKDPAIGPKAKELLGGEVTADRRAVVDRYRQAADAVGNPAAGASTFRRVCANCHRVRGEGHDVGPDLSDVRNKTPETLLGDILDPNRAVEPRFGEYVVATSDGRVLAGILESENDEAVVLRAAENKRQSIPRSQIHELRASGKSIMPEGVEKQITPEQMVDLIAFLKSGEPGGVNSPGRSP